MLEDLSISMVKRAILRRIWMIGIIGVVGTTIAVVWAFTLPPKYVARAKVLIESQQIPERLASSTVTIGVSERLRLLEQRLMSRDNLLGLVERLGLFEDEPDLTSTDIVGRMRASTRFTQYSLGGNRRGQSSTAFEISYVDENGARAAQITNELVTLVLEGNLKARSERATDTLEFFENQVNNLGGELRKAEAELARFTIEHRNALPSSLEYRRQALTQIEDNRIELQRQINTLEERDRVLTLQLERGQYGPGGGVNPLDEEIANLRADLIRKSTLYREGHPQVRRLETMIEELSRARENAVVPAAASDREQFEREVAKRELERKIEVTREDLKLVRQKFDQLESRAVSLQESIEATPEVGLRLNVLNRRVGDLASQYQSALSRKAEAEIGETLEVNRKSERFEVIEQARVPDSPSSPNRRKIAATGSALSIGLALGLAMLLELLHRAIWTPAELERRLDMRPLITVPYIETSQERSRRKRKLLFRGTVLILCVPATVWALHTFYMPLDLLIDRFLERSGVEQIARKLMARFGL